MPAPSVPGTGVPGTEGAGIILVPKVSGPSTDKKSALRGERVRFVEWLSERVAKWVRD